jgi:long-chain fatty acid transport protein
MKNILKHSLTSVAVAALLASPLANATNGYFKIGYGSKNRGMAGAGMAYGQDTLAPAVNPATLTSVFAGSDDRIDAGVEIFKPKRKGEVDATGIGGALSDEKSRSNAFFIPSFGIGSKVNNKLFVGVSAVANGGLNTRYGDSEADTNPNGGNIYTDAFAPAIPGFIGNLIAAGADPANTANNAGMLAMNPNITPTLGVNLAQVLIMPTLAYQITQNHSVGFSPIIGYQTFRGYGLGLFQAFSSDPGNVTNNGNDDAWGYGAKLGYQGNFGRFSIGASAQSKVYMDEFDDYSGLFAEQGDLDIPATFGVGIAFHATPKLTIAADVSRILYGDVDAIANKGPTANEFFSAFSAALTNGDPSGPFGAVSNPLGSNDGWGFGWDDVWVYKVGVDWEYNNAWTFRAGYNYAEVPYDDEQALFNVLAPAVVEHHVTAGFTYNVNPSAELTVTYMHAFRNDVETTYTGTGPFAGLSYGAKNDMYQNAIEASYAYKF